LAFTKDKGGFEGELQHLKTDRNLFISYRRMALLFWAVVAGLGIFATSVRLIWTDHPEKK